MAPRSGMMLAGRLNEEDLFRAYVEHMCFTMIDPTFKVGRWLPCA